MTGIFAENSYNSRFNIDCDRIPKIKPQNCKYNSGASSHILAKIFNYSDFQVTRPRGRGKAMLCPDDRCGSNTENCCKTKNAIMERH
ncbi:MAG: hypothetical protein V7K43_16520 [Nostoc sp.]